jgi:hypothetical protein
MPVLVATLRLAGPQRKAEPELAAAAVPPVRRPALPEAELGAQQAQTQSAG